MREVFFVSEIRSLVDGVKGKEEEEEEDEEFFNFVYFLVFKFSLSLREFFFSFRLVLGLFFKGRGV